MLLPSTAEVKSKGNQLKAAGIGALACFVSNGIFYFVCHDHGMALFAGAGVGVCIYVLMVSGALVAPQVMQPAARLYNVTPLYVMREIKEALNTSHFGDRKWQFEDMNQEKLTLSFVFKHSKEIDLSIPGQGGGGKQKDEGIVRLAIRLERVGEGASVETVFTVVHGIIDFDMQDIVKQTTQLIDLVLKAMEAQRQARELV